MWRLNNMLLNNKWNKGEIKQEIKNYLETSYNENTTFQNLQDFSKSSSEEKFIAIQAYLKKQEKSQINNLILHLKKLKRRTNRPQSKQKRGNSSDQR